MAARRLAVNSTRLSENSLIAWTELFAAYGLTRIAYRLTSLSEWIAPPVA